LFDLIVQTSADKTSRKIGKKSRHDERNQGRIMKIQKSDQAAETDSRSEKHLQNKTIHYSNASPTPKIDPSHSQGGADVHPHLIRRLTTWVQSMCPAHTHQQQAASLLCVRCGLKCLVLILFGVFLKMFHKTVYKFLREIKQHLIPAPHLNTSVVCVQGQ